MCKTKMRACLCAVVLVAVVFGVWYYIANVRSVSTPNGTLVKDMKNIKDDVKVASRNIVQDVKKAGDNVKKDSQELVQETKDASKEAYQNMKQTGKEIAEATAETFDGISDCFLEKDEETNV